MTIEISAKGVELLQAYRQEAIEALADAQTASLRFKEVIETASESTGVKAAKISAYYKAEFGEKVEDIIDTAEFFALLRGKE